MPDGLLSFDDFELGVEILDVHEGPDGTVGELLDDHDGPVCVDVLADFEGRDETLDVQVSAVRAVGELLDDHDGTACVDILADFEGRDETLDVQVGADVTNGTNCAIHSEDVAFSDLGKKRKPLGVLLKKRRSRQRAKGRKTRTDRSFISLVG